MTVGGNAGVFTTSNDGADVRDIVTNGWNCRTRVYCNFLLGAGGEQETYLD